MLTLPDHELEHLPYLLGKCQRLALPCAVVVSQVLVLSFGRRARNLPVRVCLIGPCGGRQVGTPTSSAASMPPSFPPSDDDDEDNVQPHCAA